MKLRAVIHLRNGSIAVRDTSCIYQQCYDDGAAYLASCSGWVKHTLTKSVLNRATGQSHEFGGNVAEPFIRYTVHNEINAIKNEGKHIKNMNIFRKPKSKKSKSVQCSSWY